MGRSFWIILASISLFFLIGAGFVFDEEAISAEKVSLSVAVNSLEKGVVTPASCGVNAGCWLNPDGTGGCSPGWDVGHPEYGGACSPPPAPPPPSAPPPSPPPPPAPPLSPPAPPPPSAPPPSPPPPPAPTASFSASPTSIIQGQSATLSWSSSNATSCNINQGIGSVPSSGSATVFPNTTTTYTLTCSGPGGTTQNSATVNVSAQTLSVALTPSPSSGTAPLSVNLTASVSGTAFGTINYAFWWNCSNPTANINAATSACGSLPAPSAGSCAQNSNGLKCDSVNETGKTVSQVYFSGGNFTSKVIAERGSAPPAENRSPITVNWPPLSVSCSVSPTSAITGQTVTWSATSSGGSGSYTYFWSGTDGLSGATPSVQKSYSNTGTKTGSVNVTSGGQSRTISCNNSVNILGAKDYPCAANNQCGTGLICSSQTNTCVQPPPRFQEIPHQ